MAKVANDAVARPTNAQPRGVGLGREEGLLPRLGGDDRHRAAPVCSLQFPVSDDDVQVGLLGVALTRGVARELLITALTRWETQGRTSRSC